MKVKDTSYSKYRYRSEKMVVSVQIREVLEISRFKKVRYKIQKWGGNASSPLFTFDICAVALGRYAVLFSTASRPFRLSALQNACVCPCMGSFCNFYLLIAFFPLYEEWKPQWFPFSFSLVVKNLFDYYMYCAILILSYCCSFS